TWASARSAASSRMSASGPTGSVSKAKNRGQTPISSTQRATSPLEDDPEARRQEILGFFEADPAPFVVLGAAELGGHGQLYLRRLGLGEKVARDLVAAVRQRVLVRV